MPRQVQEQEEVQEQAGAQEDAPRTGRSRGLNQVTLVGRLTRDPELRMTTEGIPRAWFVLAVGRGFAPKDGERDADFISIVAWRQLAEVVSEHLKKGRLVGITGRLQVRRLDDGSGKPRTSTEVVADNVVFLDAPRRPKEEEEPDNQD